MPDRRETMAGFIASQKIEYGGFFTIPDYRDTGGEDTIKIPAHYEVCPTCHGAGKHVNPSIDSNGITQSEMEELGEEFREGYWSGTYDVTCNECKGSRVVLEPNRDTLTREQVAVLAAYENALSEEAQEIDLRNKGYQF